MALAHNLGFPRIGRDRVEAPGTRFMDLRLV